MTEKPEKEVSSDEENVPIKKPADGDESDGKQDNKELEGEDLPEAVGLPVGTDQQAFIAYQPTYVLVYVPVVIVPSPQQQALMAQMQFTAQQDIEMSPTNPNSPYYKHEEYTSAIEEDAGVYIGEVDAAGMRFGTGTCTWADGSKYHGDWNQNVRHGNGTFETPADGTKYEGEWINDHKHGNGEQMQKNGTKVQGQWQRDRLNGLAYITKKGEKEPTTVIFKDDMRIQANDSGLTCCDKFYVFISCTIFFLVLAGAVLGNVPAVGPPAFGACCFYFVLVAISCCQTATRYLCNLVELEKVFENIKKAIESPPCITFHIQCYHYETVHYTTTDKDGNTQHKTRRERVNTHHATKEFKIKKWEDRSPPAETLHFLSVLLLSRLHTDKEINFSSKAHHRFQKKKKKFIRHNDRDKYYDYHCTKEILFHQAECLVYSPKLGAKPWFTNVCLMVALDFVMLGWIPRFCLNKKTKIVEYEMIKYLHN